MAKATERPRGTLVLTQGLSTLDTNPTAAGNAPVLGAIPASLNHGEQSPAGMLQYPAV